jgi:hypothetical protein
VLFNIYDIYDFRAFNSEFLDFGDTLKTLAAWGAVICLILYFLFFLFANRRALFFFFLYFFIQLSYILYHAIPGKWWEIYTIKELLLNNVIFLVQLFILLFLIVLRLRKTLK